MEQPSTKKHFTSSDGAVRPVWFVMTDGGPDENPRHLKNVTHYSLLMRSNSDVDYLSVRSYAPGQSAYNPVERAMAPYSKKLAGVVIPWFEENSHLSGDKSKVVDSDLARHNFKHAGDILKRYWTDTPAYGQPFECLYEDQIPALEQMVPFDWIEIHCRIGQYSLDIKRCSNPQCCAPPKNQSFFDYLKPFGGFFLV
jgi:hypothetical protein